MNEQDLAFIRKAMEKRWLFWVFFWRWPRLLSGLYIDCLNARAERDRAVGISSVLQNIEADRNAILKQQKSLLKWVHTTHRLSNIPQESIKALFAAGRRLKLGVLFLGLAISAQAQVPPLLRNHWTTNPAPRAITTLLTNGVRAATNIWDLDFTNSATVTVTAISNAFGAVLSFTAATNGGGTGSSSMTNALLHAGPTNGSVSPLILTAGDGVTLTTSGTNRVLALSNSVAAGSSLWTSNAGVIYPTTATNYVAVPSSLWAATNELTSLLVGDVQAGIAEYGLPYEPFKFGIFRTPLPTGADIDVIWTAFSPGNSATHEFYSIARTNDGSTQTFHEVRARRDGTGSTMTMQAIAGTNYTDVATIQAGTSDLTATVRSSFGLQTFASANAAAGNGNGEAMFKLKTTLPTITNIYFLDFQTNSISVFRVDEYGNIFNKRLTPSTVLVANSTTNIASLANGTGALTNNGSGTLGWLSLTNFGGTSAANTNAIISVLTNQTAVGVGTNLNFIAGAGIQILATNLTGAGGTNTLAISATTQPPSAALTNVAAGANITNISHSPLQAGEIAITNGGLGLDRGLKSLMASTMITLTDEGTNIIVTGTGQTGSAALTNVAAGANVTNISHSPLAAGQIAITNGSAGLDRGMKSLQAGTMIALTDQNTNIIVTGTGQTGSANLTNLSATAAITNVTVTIITNTGVSLYTVPSGVKYIMVECLGGGGGGGGVDGVTSQSAAGGGGGSGAYCSTNITTPAASYIVTVGTNGLGGVGTGANAGTIGGTTLFTNILTALGGSGGGGKAAAAGVSITIGGVGALETATGKYYTGGNPGENGFCVSTALAISGSGAGSIYGGGGAGQTAAVGGNATGKGAGGGGAAVITNVDRDGGRGSPGVIIVREFYQ